jgi:E3 ubiquitin-protein ligase synoviolin
MRFFCPGTNVEQLIALLGSLLLVDIGMSYYAARETLTRGPSMLIMFWFEYSLVGFGLLSSIVKYLLNIVELRNGGWDSKGVWVMYVEFATDCLKLLT